MRLHILSDVHLEFAPYTPPAVSTDVVVLAGDIDVGCNGVAWAAEHFPTSTVLYVLGNHEYYRQAHASHIARVKKRAKGTNVVVLENDAVVVDDTLFLGCTLWTDFNLFGDPEMAGRHARSQDERLSQNPTSPGWPQTATGRHGAYAPSLADLAGRAAAKQSARQNRRCDPSRSQQTLACTVLQ